MSNDASTRRQILTTVVAGTIGATLLASSQASAQATKQSKADAQYQDKPNNGHLCGICAFFLAPSSCQVVDGTIIPTGWCKNFQLKT